MSAKDRLISILNEKIIHASIMPWTYANAVCFTGCPWSSLISHTNNYSPYGIGFNKSFVYSRHGGPVFYIRPDHFKKQIKNSSFDKHVWPFITPFSPTYLKSCALKSILIIAADVFDKSSEKPLEQLFRSAFLSYFVLVKWSLLLLLNVK